MVLTPYIEILAGSPTFQSQNPQIQGGEKSQISSYIRGKNPQT
jgi:hypothetical protein